MLINAFVAACAVLAIVLTGQVLHRRTLVQRLQAFRYSIMVLVPSLIALAIVYAVEARIRDPRLPITRGDAVDVAWFTSVSEAQSMASMLLVGVMFVFVLLAVQLLAVLTLARRFVIAQEIDLVARDQIALHQSTKSTDVEGIPVSGIGAPRPTGS